MTAVQPSLLAADLTPAPGALPPGVKPPKPAPLYGLLVNEVRIYATTQGADWWTQHRPRFDHCGKTRILSVAIPGELIELGPYPKDDADFMRSHMVKHGVHKSAVKVRRWKPDLPTIGGTS